MGDLRVVLSKHAVDWADKRQLRPEWIERVALDPAIVVPDPKDPTVRRHYRRIPELGNRVLRVACRHESDTLFVLSAFFDRNARRFV